jgi:hypothetical protein
MKIRLLAFLALVVLPSTRAFCIQPYELLAQPGVLVERSPLPPEIVRDSPQIQARDNIAGTWQVSYLEYEGTSRPDIAPKLLMKFTRGRLDLIQAGRPTITAAYTLGEGIMPAAFSWSYLGPGGMGVQSGICWLKGGQLVICLGATGFPAATDFLTQPFDRKTLFVLQRVP